jgi:hypothetical protein
MMAKAGDRAESRGLGHGMTAAPLFLLADGLLLALWPVAWTAPLLRTGLVPFLEGDAVSVLSGVAALWRSDPALAALVAGLGVLAPFLKALALTAVHVGWLGPRALPTLEVLGKLSMADVFLLAMVVVVAKGVGIGRVEPAWGLHLFAGVALASLALSHFTARSLRRFA